MRTVCMTSALMTGNNFFTERPCHFCLHLFSIFHSALQNKWAFLLKRWKFIPILVQSRVQVGIFTGIWRVCSTTNYILLSLFTRLYPFSLFSTLDIFDDDRRYWSILPCSTSCALYKFFCCRCSLKYTCVLSFGAKKNRIVWQHLHTVVLCQEQTSHSTRGRSEKQLWPLKPAVPPGK